MILSVLHGGLFSLTLTLAPEASPPELPPEPEVAPAPALESTEPGIPVPAPAPEVPAPKDVQDAAESGAGPVPPPEQVRDAAESGAGPVPPPEHVRDAAESGAGPVPPPEQVRDAAEPGPGPNPNAPPSEGVHAVGSSGVAPLPPPPPPVSPDTIPRGSWRGVGWLSVRLHVSGPIAGLTPARPTVVSLGGGAEGGWRIRQWVGLGSGFSRQPHEVYRESLPDGLGVMSTRGYMTAWDVAFLRFYAPVRGRIDPYIDVGAGLSFFDPARDRPTEVGTTVRASAGFDAWVARNLTLGLSGIYRANFVDDAVGHAWQAALEFGIHW